MVKYKVVFKNTEKAILITKEEYNVLLQKLQYPTGGSTRTDIVSLSENTVVNIDEILVVHNEYIF